jgi:DNA-binding GntR family transcriptional regulator
MATQLTRQMSNNGAPTLTETVYHTLLHQIVSGELAPGTRLMHRELSRQMKTSTLPVIEAIRRLEGMGLLETIPRVGSMVREWQPQEIEDIYQLRAAHEGVACRMFSQRATRADFMLLQLYHEEFGAAVRAGQTEEDSRADERFHLHIVRATGSRELIRVVESSGLILLTVHCVMFPAEIVLADPEAHTPLLEALSSGDPDRAEGAGRAHVLQSWDVYQQRLREYHQRHPEADGRSR